MAADVAFLISETYTKDELLQNIATYTERQIFVYEKSVSRSEWSIARQSGHKPSMVLYTPRVNYNGEMLLRYHNKVYSIYRVYESDSEAELYCELREGNLNVEIENGED